MGWMVGVAVLLSLWGWAAVAQAFNAQHIYGRTVQAVVLIQAHDAEGQGSQGTGSIIHPDGFVLTNAHVLLNKEKEQPYPRIFVFLKPEELTGKASHDLARRFKAEVVDVNRPLDLALLRLVDPPERVPSLKLGDSDHVQIGDPVVALGHPEMGGRWTLTTGTISAQFIDFQNTEGLNVFQTETSLNRGNSGGPLLDAAGHLIGINSMIARLAKDNFPITGINFAIQSNVAYRWLRRQGIDMAEPAIPSPTLDSDTGDHGQKESTEPEAALEGLKELMEEKRDRLYGR